MSEASNRSLRDLYEALLSRPREVQPSEQAKAAILTLADLAESGNSTDLVLAVDGLRAIITALDELNVPLPADELAEARNRRAVMEAEARDPLTDPGTR